ncbi:hypothetical protein M8C21_004300 [Ambrosia artemisiifolia]|uniref:S1 motif domain-containing protein n=1 Tax=Ambrosia artemisiifolia TaxID=4212 RepID=A0AAD5DCE5_AMBAR|nr:hypothetical protein M8C21_004300 [Ambrosia artemisiifolia]
MYEAPYPEVGTLVMIQVTEIGAVVSHVSLLEYNNIKGRIQLSDRRRTRSVGSVIKVGSIEVAMVLRVDAERGYIDLSRKRLSEQDVQICVDRYSKSKVVHSIMRHVAVTKFVDLEDLYIHVGWPLYRKYGHAFEAFKVIVNDPDSVLKPLTQELTEFAPDGRREVTKVVPAISGDVIEALVRIIKIRMIPHPVKIRADIEMECVHYDGILHIKEAMRKAEAAGTKDCPVKIRLVAPPSYVLDTQTLDKEQGIKVLSDAIAACAATMEHHKGKLTVKEPPRSVSKLEDKRLAELMTKLRLENAEIVALAPLSARVKAFGSLMMVTRGYWEFAGEIWSRSMEEHTLEQGGGGSLTIIVW